MNLHLQINRSNARHTSFTVFIDGVSCGELTMLTADFPTFHMILGHGKSDTMDTYRSSGHFYDPTDERA